MQVFEIKSNGLILNRRKRPKSDESSYGERQYPNRTNQLFTRTNLKLSFRFPHNPFFFKLLLKWKVKSLSTARE